MKKKLFIFMTMLLSSLIVLSACGTGDDNSDTEQPEQEENTSAVDEEATEDESEAPEGDSTEEETEEPDGEETDSEGDGSQIVEENEAFRIFEPAPNTVVDNEFTVRGEARVFEGTVQYEFEDGHNILDEGFVTASAAAPEWGEFEITITFEDVAFDSGTLILYEESAEDGSRQNELLIPVKVEK